MKKRVPVILMALMTFILLGSVSASQSPVLWNGTVCENIEYQKSIEAVALTDNAVYVACSYRQTVNSSGIIQTYYLGFLAAYSVNGTGLWQNFSGYTVKLVPAEGGVLAGSFGALLNFDENGRIVSLYEVTNKLYDFVVSDGMVYIADGDFFLSGGSISYKGHVYAVKLGGNLTGIWNVTFNDMITRVRVADGIIYASSGFPSGYTGGYQFGSLYGVSPEGEPLWNLSIGHWVRDLEVWNGNAVLGTGWDGSKGSFYVVSPSGAVLLNGSLFYTEDIVVVNDTAYVGGYDGKNGTLVALELPSGEVRWEVKFPYRVKALAYADGVLLVGTGKFESRAENGTTYVYSVGDLYAVNLDGEVLEELPNIGYVRSIAVKDDKAVVGTASSTFYVVDVNALKGGQKTSICGPGLVVVLALLALIPRASHRNEAVFD